jgi:peptide deformylase
LVYYPDPVLLRPAAPVKVVTPEVRAKSAEMVPFMELEKGVGLAAPQVGWSARVLVASEDGDGKKARVFINPVIVWKGGGNEWGEEGCLSFPGIYGQVLRAQKVRIQCLDLEAQEVTVEAGGFFARVLQHEIDHLDGILFITKLRPADKVANRPKLLELVRRKAEPAGVPDARQ